MALATPVFVVGYDKAVSVKLNGAGAAITLNVTAWSHEPAVNTLIVTHTGSGGLQARIAGIFDTEGTVEANMDSANFIMLVAGGGVLPGARGLLTAQIGMINPFSIPIIIQKVPFKSTVDGLVQFTFTFQLDSQSGSYVVPAT